MHWTLNIDLVHVQIAKIVFSGTLSYYNARKFIELHCKNAVISKLHVHDQ